MDTKIQPVISSPKRGPYRRHTDEFKRVVVAKSLASGVSVSRVAREFNVNANQVFAWRKQFGGLPLRNAEMACQLLPITVSEPPPEKPTRSNAESPATAGTGVIVLTVGAAQLRLEGDVDPATLAQVLARLLP
jgi:transposase